ncbi:MAG: aspartate dehydrogenase [Pseudomonadota bacterium]
MVRILMIGHGTIASYVAADLRTHDAVEPVGVLCRPGREAAAYRALGDAYPPLPALPDPAGIDLVLDCAGHDALSQHGAQVLSAGVDLMTVSTGALADEALAASLEEAAVAGKSCLHLVPGAVGGIDALSAAKAGGLEAVIYRGRKPPAGWKGSPAETSLDLDRLTAPATHFIGSARDAARLYPRNANVAATIALAGLGFDATRVELIAEPGLRHNVHEIKARGAFGRLDLTLEGNPLPGNPRSSALTAMSMAQAVRRRLAPVRL